MRRITKQIKWGATLIILLLMGLMLFNEQVTPLMAQGSRARVTSPNCASAANPSTLAQLNLCYQSLLTKFSSKFLNDLVNVDPALVRSALKGMQEPSLVQLAGQIGYPGDFYLLERQELMNVDKMYIDLNKVDPLVVKGYNATVDKPLFDQFAKQLSSINNQSLDQLVTGAILATQPPGQAGKSQACNVMPPIYKPLPQVDPSSDGAGNVTYHGGHVIDGTANVYLIFWIDPTFQSPSSAKYLPLIEQFVKDAGRSSYYMNLLQYDDSSTRCPANAQLAGKYVDTQPFPQNVLANQKNPKADPKVVHNVDDQAIRQEIASVAAQKRWNTQDYHNVFVILPILSERSTCGTHDWLHTGTNGLQRGSPFIFIPYLQPQAQGKLWCDMTQSPNHDPATDNTIYALSNMLVAAITAPYADSWNDASHMDLAGKCISPVPPQIDPKTKGNVNWQGDIYVVSEAYDNLRQGCVLKGP